MKEKLLLIAVSPLVLACALLYIAVIPVRFTIDLITDVLERTVRSWLNKAESSLE